MIQIDMREQANGIYFYNLVSEEGVISSGKFILE
jgi:hypothetical protein